MSEETAGTPRTDREEQFESGVGGYVSAHFAGQLEREVAVLTADLKESESQKLGWKKSCENWNEQANKSRQPDTFYEDYSEGTMRAMQALMTRAIERAETAEAEVDAAKRALAELVACKDLKDRIEWLSDAAKRKAD